MVRFLLAPKSGKTCSRRNSWRRSIPLIPRRCLKAIWKNSANCTPLKRMLYADLKVWLPDNLLLRGDLMTMAASIEERVPFLDHKLVEFAARLPTKLLTQGFRTKVLLKRAFEPFLPPEVLYRRKVGFAVPVGEWFRKPLKSLVADLVLSREARARGYFNAGEHGKVRARALRRHSRPAKATLGVGEF